MASEKLEAAVDDLVIANERVRIVGSPDHAIGLGELAAEAIESSGAVNGRCVLSSVPTYPSYSVNVATRGGGPRHWTGPADRPGCRAGTWAVALNPLLVEGQMQGGAIQSIGFGLMEGVPV